MANIHIKIFICSIIFIVLLNTLVQQFICAADAKFDGDVARREECKEYGLKFVKEGDEEREIFDLSQDEITLLTQSLDNKRDLDSAYRLYYYYKEVADDPKAADSLLCLLAGDSSGVNSYDLASYFICVCEGEKKYIYLLHKQPRYILASCQVDRLLLELENGSGDAAYRLYEYYFFYKQDFDEALKFIIRAEEFASKKFKSINLAEAYVKAGVKNKNKRMEYFSLAKKWALIADTEHDYFAKDILDYLEHSSFLPHEIDELRKAAEKGDPAAAYTLYRYYGFPENGPGGQRDESNLLYFLDLAALNGNSECQLRLLEACYSRGSYRLAKQWLIKFKNNSNARQDEIETLGDFKQKVIDDKNDYEDFMRELFGHNLPGDSTF